MGKRAAIYLRVSTDEQTTENQKADLLKLADLRCLEVVATYADEGISGTKGRDKRPGLDALLKDAKRRRFDIALFWSVDRLGRSTAGVATAMDELEAAGVAQFYFKESMDTSTAHGRAMLEMAAVFARLEREMIVGRIKAGMARVKAAGGKTKTGNPLGRPKVAPEVETAILRARSDNPGLGIVKLAKQHGVGVSVVQRLLKPAA
jgi:DNA invertase Pin-like site-specific DNA recombinase